MRCQTVDDAYIDGDGRSKAAAAGFGWSAVGYATQGIGQILVVGVLARYISAEEFGVVSATLLVIGFGKLFTQSMVGPALVQRSQISRAHLVTGMWCSVAMGTGVAALIALLAPVVGNFFRFDDLQSVLLVLSLSFVLQAPGVTSEALLQRRFAFKKLAIADSLSFVIGYCLIGVTLAILGAGVWALVAASLAQVAIDSALLIFFARPAVWGRPARAPAVDIVRFGTGFTLGRVFNYGAGQGDYFVIGRWMSAADLGFYSRAYQLIVMPAMLLGQVLDRVLFPLMSSMQHDRQRLTDIYRRGVALIVVIIAPLSALVIVLAPEIVRVSLGSKWSAVVSPLRILAIGLVARTGYKLSDSLARSTGTVYKRAWRQAIFATLVVVGSLIGRAWGLEGVAVGVLIAITTNYLMMASLSMTTTSLTWAAFARAHNRGLVLAAIAGALSILVAAPMRSGGLPALVILGVCSLSCALAFAVAGLHNPRRLLGADAWWIAQRLRRPATK